MSVAGRSPHRLPVTGGLALHSPLAGSCRSFEGKVRRQSKTRLACSRRHWKSAPRCLRHVCRRCSPTAGLGYRRASGHASTCAQWQQRVALDSPHARRPPQAVGKALRLWEAEGKGREGAVLVESKCSTYEMGFDKARAAFRDTLGRLGRETLDVYVIHWPAVAKKPHSSEVPEGRTLCRGRCRCGGVLSEYRP